MHPFFYRFDHLDLTPGNKSAGFVFSVSTEALLSLMLRPATVHELRLILEAARTRIFNAGLRPLSQLSGLSIGFHGATGCPRFFAADPVFGGSVGADPETFSRLEHPDKLEWIGEVVDYTPHNLDDAKGALSTMLLAQT